MTAIIQFITFFWTLFLFITLIYLLQGPPFVPSDNKTTKQITELVKKYKAKQVLDLGSGDGKLVIALAKSGINTDGIELNPTLVKKSLKTINKSGVADKANIKWGSFWSYNVSGYDLIVVYVVKHIMPKLEQKLKKELKPGTIVISNYANFPNLKPILKKDRILVYKF